MLRFFVGVILLGATCNAFAEPVDPPIHTQSPYTLTTDGGTTLRLPPSYILTEPAWDVLDLEMKRLQDAETRLDAENQSLRKSAGTWSPGWKSLVTVFAVGLGVGIYSA